MLEIGRWNLGVSLSSRTDPEALVYFRFYEWHLFDAVVVGDHTRGIDDWEWDISPDGGEASIQADWMQVNVRTVDDGAEIALSVTNHTDHDWPQIAAIIPCLGAEYARYGLPASPAFFDDGHERTYYLGTDGLDLLRAREIHYAAPWVETVLDRSPRGDGAFEAISHKWPHSDRAATAGLMVRESADRRWVTGVAWQDFLSAQGHNPRRCMHLSVRVGPLARGETKSVKGKIYLMPGTREDVLGHYLQDFCPVPSTSGGSS
jgi:hypothetical protein